MKNYRIILWIIILVTLLQLLTSCVASQTEQPGPPQTDDTKPTDELKLTERADLYPEYSEFSNVTTHAAGEAFRAIKHGYADAIIAGGAEASIHPLAIGGFANSKALSRSTDPKNASIPFSANRNGFVMGEGAGVLIFESLEHAQKRGAKIYAEVVGYGNSCDAHHVTAPSPDGIPASRAIKQSLTEAKFDAERDTLYINAHGTSTPLNDKSETTAIKLALGEEAARKAMISSTKSMTGHMLGATGAVELIAATLTLKEGLVPPTIGLNDPDPECDLDYVPNIARKADVTVAISNSLGFGGHNSCVALRKWNG